MGIFKDGFIRPIKEIAKRMFGGVVITAPGATGIFMGNERTPYEPYSLGGAGVGGSSSWYVIIDAQGIQMRRVLLYAYGNIGSYASAMFAPQIDVSAYSKLCFIGGSNGQYAAGTKVGIKSGSTWIASATISDPSQPNHQVVDISAYDGVCDIVATAEAGGGGATYYTSASAILAVWLEP